MLIALSVLLLLVVLWALAYPIVIQGRGKEQTPVASSAEERLADLLAERDAAFQAIRDLHFDHEVGKISDADLAVFEANLKQAAAESLRRLDAWEDEADGALGRSVEKLVAARRSALTRAGSRACPQCGRQVAADDQFCTGCGATLAPVPRAAAAPAGPTCPQCGRALAADDRFCPKCGQALAQLARG